MERRLKQTIWMLTFFLVLGFVGVFYSASAHAKSEPCSHPIFVEKGCEQVAIAGPKGAKGDTGPQGKDGSMGPVGPQGPAGKQGKTGKTGEKGERGVAGPVGPAGPRGLRGLPGADGKDGKDGINGRDGIDGKDGAPGMDYAGPNYRTMRKEFSNFIAASNAIQVHLPRTSNNRITANVFYVDSTAGVGFGYARSLDEDSDLTFGVGTAGGEYVFQLGVSGEF